MTSLLSSGSRDTNPSIAWHDRVCVPDGRVGEVIGFYRREEESVLVSFSLGVPAEFLTTEVETV